MDNHIRISVTDLEYFHNPPYAQSVDAICERLTKQTPPSPAAMRGTAIHALIPPAQTPNIAHRSYDPDTRDYLVDTGYGDEPQRVPIHVFNGIYAELNRLGFAINSPLMQYEHKTRKQYTSHQGTPVYVSGVADALCGNEAFEFKTTANSIRSERYYGSLQWKFYCDMFNVGRVTYYIFQINWEGLTRKYIERHTEIQAINPDILLYGGDKTPCLRTVVRIDNYAPPVQNLAPKVQEFVNFCDENGILDFFIKPNSEL